jgi:hypothetical protein
MRGLVDHGVPGKGYVLGYEILPGEVSVDARKVENVLKGSGLGLRRVWLMLRRLERY